MGECFYLVAYAFQILGSIATTAHSFIGNVAAGSIIAVGQSAGGGGTGLTIINGVAQAGGAIMSVGSAGIAWLKTKETTN